MGGWSVSARTSAPRTAGREADATADAMIMTSRLVDGRGRTSCRPSLAALPPLSPPPPAGINTLRPTASQDDLPGDEPPVPVVPQRGGPRRRLRGAEERRWRGVRWWWPRPQGTRAICLTTSDANAPPWRSALELGAAARGVFDSTGVFLLPHGISAAARAATEHSHSVCVRSSSVEACAADSSPLVALTASEGGRAMQEGGSGGSRLVCAKVARASPGLRMKLWHAATAVLTARNGVESRSSPAADDVFTGGGVAGGFCLQWSSCLVPRHRRPLGGFVGQWPTEGAI